MELKELLNTYEIIGIVSNYQSSLPDILVSNLNIKNMNKALLMVGLDESILSKKVSELTLSELFKVDLLTKLDKDIIIIGNLSKNLIYKDIEFINKLLLKLNNEYNKKIVIIDEDIKVFMNLVKYIYVMKNKQIIYSTNNFFDDELYKYVKMPKIIEFIKYVNKDEKRVDETLEIYELIKDIFRRLS